VDKSIQLRHVGAPRSSELRRKPQFSALLSPPPPAPRAQPRSARLRLDPPPPPCPQTPATATPAAPLHRAPLPPHQDAVSTDESRTPPPPLPQSAGFGPFRWNMRPLRGAPVSAWDATAASSSAGSGGGQVMLSPFFRFPAPQPVTPVTGIREIAPVSPLVRLGSSSGGYTGPSTRMVVGGDHNDPWLAARAAGMDFSLV
jgi:hypothetical protein